MKDTLVCLLSLRGAVVFSMSLRGAIATWQSPIYGDQIATASTKPRNDNKSAARNDRGKTAVQDEVSNRRPLS